MKYLCKIEYTLVVRIFNLVFFNLEPMIVKAKPKEQTPKETKLQNLKRQHVRVGIFSYKQIGYVEWIDYFNKPFVISSKNNNIQKWESSKKTGKTQGSKDKVKVQIPQDKIVSETLIKRKNKKTQSITPKSDQPQLKPKNELNNSYTDSDISFDITKKKQVNHNIYKNVLVDEPKPQEDLLKDMDISETPEPISKYDCTPEKLVRQDFDQIFLYNSAVKNLMEEYQEDHESESCTLELRDPKGYTQECSLQIDHDLDTTRLKGKQPF